MMGTAAPVSAGGRLQQILVAAMGLNEVLSVLRSVPKPGKELASIVGTVKSMFDKQAETGQEPRPEDLASVLKSLQGLKEQLPAVAKAVKMLKGILGIDEEPATAEVVTPPAPAGKTAPDFTSFLEMLRRPPAPGNIPVFSQGQIKASIKPNVYRARLIKAGRALDGTVWTEDALKAAVAGGMFEGRPVKVMVFHGRYGDIENHLPDEVITHSLVGNQVGFVKGASWDPAERAVYASVWITDPGRASLLDTMIEQGVELPGMSIYATGEKGDDERVTRISEIDSMDLVTFPAAEGRILARALSASVKMLSVLKGAGQMANEPVQPAPQEPVAAAPAAPAAPAEPAPEGQFGGTWLTEQATRFATDILAGQPEPEGLQDKIAKVVEGLQALEYDPAKYPINVVVVLLNRVYNAVTGKGPEEPGKPKEDQAKAQGQQPQAPAGAQPQKPPAQPQTAGAVAKQQAIGGAQSMDRAVAEKIVSGLQSLNNRLAGIEQRVNVVDTESMVAEKLVGSSLPDPMKLEMAKQLKGVPVSESELDRFINMQQRVIAGMNGTLARKASVNVDGEVIGGGPDTVEAAMADLLGTTKRG
jgi:hypothetical protein